MSSLHILSGLKKNKKIQKCKRTEFFKNSSQKRNIFELHPTQTHENITINNSIKRKPNFLEIKTRKVHKLFVSIERNFI